MSRISIKEQIAVSDLAVIHAILNPNEPFDVASQLSQTDAPSDQSHLDEEVEKNESHAKLRCLERDAISLAENGLLVEALSLLDNLIRDNSWYASAFNNRAQIKRLLLDNEGALLDLTEAVNLTNSQGEVASMALTQRGCLRRLMGNTEDARSDLEKASQLGCVFAKRVLIEMNPYAALCNDMLTSVIEKCQMGEQMYC